MAVRRSFGFVTLAPHDSHTFSTRSIKSRLLSSVSRRRVRRSLTISHTRDSSSHFGWTTSLGHAPRTLISCWPARMKVRAKREIFENSVPNNLNGFGRLTGGHDFFGPFDVCVADFLESLRLPDECIDALHRLTDFGHFWHRVQMCVEASLWRDKKTAINQLLRQKNGRSKGNVPAAL